MKKYIHFIIIISISSLYFFTVNQNNLGVTPDSVKYIEAAKNISNGKGFVIDNNPVTHYPIGYAFMLSCTSKITGLSVLQSGKYLNLFLYIVNGFIFFLILKEIGFGYITQSFILATFLLSRPLMVAFYFWSELQFIMLINLAFLLYLKWKKNDSQLILLLLGSTCFLAFITRYAAIGFIGGFLINFLLLKNKAIAKKLLIISYYLLPIFLGLVIWIFYTSLDSNPTKVRSFVVHIVPLQKIVSSFKAMIPWFTNNIVTSALILLIIPLIGYYLYKSKTNFFKLINAIKKNTKELFIIVITYVVFILCSISFFDAHTPIDTRILSPTFMFILLIVGYIIHNLSLYIVKWNNTFILSLLLLFSLSTSANVWYNMYKNGFGYTGKDYQPYTSIIKEHITSYKGITYSNASDFIQFNTNKNLKIKSIPFKFNPGTNQRNLNYETEINNLKTDIINGNTQVVYFDKMSIRWYLMSKEELLTEMKNQSITEFKDGFIINPQIEYKN